MKENLNEYQIPCDEEHYRWTMKDYSIKIDNPTFNSIELITRDLEKRLIEIIDEYKDYTIFGCVAWLTSIPILEALQKVKNVQIIIQKEDFLRPDIYQSNGNNKWKYELKKQYNLLNNNLHRYELKKPINILSWASSVELDPVRCVGNYNSNKSSAFPRSHHKFIVICETNGYNDEGKLLYHPIAAWTGSFNFTKNASYSFENAIFMVDKSGENPILNGLLGEHHQIFGLSEPLNWEYEWSFPEFRIGT